MPKEKMDLGPSGETARHRLKEIRGRITYAELSRMLDEIGRPISAPGLRRIEAGERRIDIDDLMALSVALEVSPATLLMPYAAEPDDTVTATGAGERRADTLWQWLIAYNPLKGGRSSDLAEFWVKAWPRWELDEDRHKVREGKTRLVLKHPAHKPKGAK